MFKSIKGYRKILILLILIISTGLILTACKESDEEAMKELDVGELTPVDMDESSKKIDAEIDENFDYKTYLKKHVKTYSKYTEKFEKELKKFDGSEKWIKNMNSLLTDMYVDAVEILELDEEHVPSEYESIHKGYLQAMVRYEKITKDLPEIIDENDTELAETCLYRLKEANAYIEQTLKDINK